MAPDPCSSALLTDSYQLSMTQAYLEHGMEGTAVFELFTRRLPDDRSFLVAAGLEQVLQYLASLSFAPEEIDWLASTGRFSEDLLDYLAGLRFRGEVWAMPEGTIFFENEPVLRVIAPIPEAQLVESRLMNLVHYSTLVASKAARSTLAARGKLLVDFGLRRAHGSEAGLLAARASYLAGFDGTSNLLADLRFGVPFYGTMAHSFVEAHESEDEAFERFARSHPDHATLLIDTYDTEAAAARLTTLASRLAARGIGIRGVRLDSGDLAAHSRQVRAILDRGGLERTRIFVSGNVDEYEIHRLLSLGAPVDGFGVGTSLVTSDDAPALDFAYKLQAYEGIPRFKLSEGKRTLPGAKQVYRQLGRDGVPRFDVIAQEGEACEGVPLLEPVMRGGKPLSAPPPLSRLRASFLESLNRLPESLRSIVNPRSYPVRLSELTSRLCRYSPETAGKAGRSPARP